MHRVLGQLWIKRAGLFPAQHIKRFDELADPVGLGAQQPQLNDLLIAEMPGQIQVDLILVDRMLPLLEQVGIAQRRFFPRA